MEHSIGICNEQGDTVLQPKPRAISVDHPNLPGKVTLDLYTGASYTVMYGPWKGSRVQPGDYIGEGGIYRTHSWLPQHPTQWEKVR